MQGKATQDNECKTRQGKSTLVLLLRLVLARALARLARRRRDLPVHEVLPPNEHSVWLRAQALNSWSKT